MISYKFNCNAGAYNKKITIYSVVETTDSNDFPTKVKLVVLQPYARVKTTSGITLIRSNSDFEKALTNFTIRYPNPNVEITREMIVEFKGKEYTIEYINNINEADVELELQCKLVDH